MFQTTNQLFYPPYISVPQLLDVQAAMQKHHTWDKGKCHPVDSWTAYRVPKSFDIYWSILL